MMNYKKSIFFKKIDNIEKRYKDSTSNSRINRNINNGKPV